MAPPNKDDAIGRWLEKPDALAFEKLQEAWREQALRLLIEKRPDSALNTLREIASTPDGKLSLNKIPRELILELICRETKKPEKRFRIVWRTLRPVGNFALFKVSYIVLVGVPLISRILPHLNLNDMHTHVFFFSLYFGTLLFAIGNLLFDAFCPTLIKRFESPNDLYKAMLDVTEKQQRLYPEDDWIGTKKHSREGYETQNKSRRAVCVFTFWLYVLGGILLGIVLVERSSYVIRYALELSAAAQHEKSDPGKK